MEQVVVGAENSRYWRPEVVNGMTAKPSGKREFGDRIPSDSLYAVGVWMKYFIDHVNYELGKIAAAFGYPRFVQRTDLDKHITSGINDSSKLAFAFPSQDAASDCREFVKKILAKDPDFGKAKISQLQIESFPELLPSLGNPELSCFVVKVDSAIEGADLEFIKKKVSSAVKTYRQHTGRIIPFEQQMEVIWGSDIDNGIEAKTTLTNQLKRIVNGFLKAGTKLQTTEEDLLLFQNGMAAYDFVNRITQESQEGDTLLVGTCYLDGEEILKKRNSEKSKFHHVHDISEGYLKNIEIAIEDAKSRGTKISAVFIEFPSNPLMECADLKTLSQLLKQEGIPLIIDQAVASCYNVNVLPYADIVVDSLTKFINGYGDAMGGFIAFNPDSAIAGQLKQLSEKKYVNECYAGELRRIVENSRDYEVRMEDINTTALELVKHIDDHYGPGSGKEYRLSKIHYPGIEEGQRKNYDEVKKETGGYGGLFSLIFNDPLFAIYFFDNLQIHKGPSFGMPCSLACFQMILTNFTELDKMLERNEPWWLIRFCTGLEKPADLMERIDFAYNEAARLTSEHKERPENLRTEDMKEKDKWIENPNEYIAEKLRLN